MLVPAMWIVVGASGSAGADPSPTLDAVLAALRAATEVAVAPHVDGI
jgi:hypothetical protein